MTYEPNDPNRMPGTGDPNGRSPENMHWGWFAGFFALLILGLIVFFGSDGNTTRTVSKNPSTSPPATTGAAPPAPAPIIEGAPNRGGAER